MKTIKFWQSLLIATVLLPITVYAQPFNNIYSFRTPYINSVHTDAVQITNGLIAEGGTIDHPLMPAGMQNVVEIGLVGTAFAPPPPPFLNGFMIPKPYYYADPDGFPLEAVDLVESLQNPNEVIEAANYLDPSGVWRIRVFKTDPATGIMAWANMLGIGLPDDLLAAAITIDNNGDVYVLGHSRNFMGFMTPYLAKIADANGAVIWENFYVDPATPNASHESVDLVFDQATTNIIFTTNRTLFNPAPPNARDGIVTVEVNSFIPMGVVATSHLPGLAGTRDIVARDMDIVNNEYVIVGRVNTAPIQAFMVRYLPGLIPAGPFPTFSTIYVPVPGGDIYFTGVKPFPMNGGMVVSMEWIDPTGILIPGMIELGPVGLPGNPGIIYNVPPPPGGGYIASRGLVSLNGASAFAMKGSIAFGAFMGIPSLSIWAENAPFVPDPVYCEDPLDLDYYYDKYPNMIMFQENNVNTWRYRDLYSDTVGGYTFDCQGGWIPNGSFKLTSGIEENSEMLGMNIYPNPTDGNFTIELSDEMTEMYQQGEIFNALGEVVMTFNVNKTIERIDLSNQVPGIYLIRLKAADGRVSEAKRIMIE